MNGNGAASLNLRLIAGHSYIIRVAPYSATSGTRTLYLVITPALHPSPQTSDDDDVLTRNHSSLPCQSYYSQTLSNIALNGGA